MRRTRAAIAVAALVGGALLSLWVQPAGAQTATTYQPGACTTPNSTQNLGSMNVGETRTFTLTPTCLFTGAVTKTVNGVEVGTENPSGGSVTVIVNAVSDTQLSIDDPVITPARIGANTIVARGTAAGNVTVTHTATFTLQRGGGGPGPTTPGPGGILSRTGSNIFRWSVAAAVLIAVGGFFVFADRRRARNRG